MMDSPRNNPRRARSLMLSYGCCVAFPLLFAISYIQPTMRYLKAMDLDNARYLDVALIGLNSTSHVIGSAKKQVGKVVSGLVGSDSTMRSAGGLTFCDTNLPSEVEYVDDIQEFSVDIANVSVCIVLSAFEHKDYIDEVMGSILDQTHKHIEVVAVDNGSTDGSKGLLLNFPKKNTNVRVVRLEQHIAEGQSYNVGIGSCSPQSTYVLLNDGITTLEKDAVASMLSYAEHLRADVVLADYDVRSTARGRELTEDTTESSYDAHQWEKLPAGSPFNVYSEPNVMRVSPVTPRKLIRRKTLVESKVEFPEGHYETAAEAFHFGILAHSTRISKLDRVLFHRLKIAQPNPLKLGAFFSNAHQVGKMLFGQASHRDCLPSISSTNIAERYYNWIEATGWISKNQPAKQMQDKFERLLKQTKYHWPQRNVLPQTYWDELSGKVDASLRVPQQQHTQIDLTIIMPTYNVKDFVGDLLVDMFAALQRPEFSFEVFAIDDGSNDGTIGILEDFQEEHSNFFLMKTPSANGGAGRARNVAIPLMEGRYVYFVDADDGYDFSALAESVTFATVNEYDLLIFPYETQTIGPKKKVETGGMMGADQKVWEKLPSEGERTHELQKEAAYGLINYPWKQLTSTRIMKDDDVFFGPTMVHNDVQFHWTSIAASHNLHFYHKHVCSHRYFDSSIRGQLTSVKSGARMSVFDSIALTQRALARQGAFDDGERNGYAYTKWLKFSRDVMNWASKRVPVEMEKEYKARWKFMVKYMARDDLKPSTLRDWPYWEHTTPSLPAP